MNTATLQKPPIAPEDTEHMLTAGEQEQTDNIGAQVSFDRFTNEPYDYTLSRHPQENKVVEGAEPQTFVQSGDHPATFERMKDALQATQDTKEVFEKTERKDALKDLGAYVTEQAQPDKVNIYDNGEPAKTAGETVASQVQPEK